MKPILQQIKNNLVWILLVVCLCASILLNVKTYSTFSLVTMLVSLILIIIYAMSKVITNDYSSAQDEMSRLSGLSKNR